MIRVTEKLRKAPQVPELPADTARREGGARGKPVRSVASWGESPVNKVQRSREALMMSKAELARKAGLSTLTIDRLEAGRPCRLDTKRKVLLALGLKVSDKDRVFGEVGSGELALGHARSVPETLERP